MSTDPQPRLRVTKDYSLFEEHETNRPLHHDGVLETSMREHGFMPSGALHVTQNGNGKLKIIRGHHRYAIAKRLGLPVWYIVDDSNINIHELEGSSKQNWSLEDFIRSRVKAGDQECLFLVDFAESNGISLSVAASLVMGESSGSANAGPKIRQGTFRRGDLTHAYQVANIVARCRNEGVPFATSTPFVNALSRVLRVPEFDFRVFIDRLQKHPALMKKRSKCEEYLEEIETLYNYQARSNRVSNLKFRANEVMKERRENFGRRRR